MRTKPCDAETRRGRLAKARAFLEAAENVETLADDGDLVDAYVTLYVHAGIAAADVLCCSRLGQHAQGQDHGEAIALLAKVDRTASRHLDRLLALKSKAGYSSVAASPSDAKVASRAAHSLVEAADAA